MSKLATFAVLAIAVAVMVAGCLASGDPDSHVLTNEELQALRRPSGIMPIVDYDILGEGADQIMSFLLALLTSIMNEHIPPHTAPPAAMGQPLQYPRVVVPVQVERFGILLAASRTFTNSGDLVTADVNDLGREACTEIVEHSIYQCLGFS